MSGKTAKDESEQQKRVVELPLELHNELILFATRKTLACLVEFNNNINCNHIGKGIAILAAKRLQSIRDQNANHQRRLLIQFLRSYKRLMNTMRISPHSPLFIGHILAPKINGVTINANILIITKGDLQFWRNGDNGFMMVEQNNRFSSNQIREITTDADKFKLNLVTRENEVPAFTVCFLWRSEFEDAVEVLKGHTTFKKPVSMSRVSVNPAARCIRNITEFVARCIWNMTDLRFYAYLICSALFILYVGIILIGSKSKVLPTDSAISLSSSHSHVDPFGSASFLIYPAVSTSGAASRVRRDHHTLDGYFKTHLSWLTDAQTEELRVMETEGKSQAEVEEKIRQFYEVSPEDVKATARGLLQKGCETVMQRVFGEFNAEEIIQAKEEGASNAEIDEKIDEALAQIRNPQKRQEAARFAMACRRIFTMIERRRREVPMAMEKTP